MGIRKIMEFKQSQKDGSCEIVFTEKECQIIQKNKSLYLSPEFLKHFGNNLVKIVMEFNKISDPTFNNLTTSTETVKTMESPNKDKV